MPMHYLPTSGQDGTCAALAWSTGGQPVGDCRPNGDHEHGWRPMFSALKATLRKGIDLGLEESLNLEGQQPIGAVLENVILDEASRTPDFTDTSLTENTRSSYPVEFMDNALLEGTGRWNIIF